VIFDSYATGEHEVDWRSGDSVSYGLQEGKTRSHVECSVKILRRQKFVVGNSGRLDRKHTSAIKPFDIIAKYCSLVPGSGYKFSKI
jgi:hypothetical protein